MYYKGMLTRLRETLFQFLPARDWWRVENVDRVFTRKIGALKCYVWRLTFARQDERRMEVWNESKVARVVKATHGGGPTTVTFRGVDKYVVFTPVAVEAATRGYSIKYKNRKRNERKRR